MLKLDLPDDEAKDDVLDALDGDGGDGGESDELDLDLDMGDDSDDDDKVEESSAARDLARLFESDDDDDDGSESLVDLDMGDDNEEGDDDDLDLDMDMSGGDDAASMLDAVADAVRGIEGDVELEVVDDMDDMDDDNEVQLDIDISTDDGEEGVDLDLEESDEMTYEVDMSEVARALKEMDTGYHKHDLPGPGKGLDDFADADEDGEKFVDGEDMGPVAESRRRRRRRGKNLREGTTRSNRRGSRFPTAREVATMRRQLAEAKRKQRDNNLLSAKLLYTNKLLQRSDLTEAHRTRITDAMDEAGNLREARLLYKNITRALDKRKRRGSLSEGRHRPVGSASQVTTSGGFNRESVATNDNPLLNESIDMDLWKRHAGLD